MDGFEQWAFMTTHSWDEPSAGIWRLEVRNGQSACKYNRQPVMNWCEICF